MFELSQATPNTIADYVVDVNDREGRTFLSEVATYEYKTVEDVKEASRNSRFEFFPEEEDDTTIVETVPDKNGLFIVSKLSDKEQRCYMVAVATSYGFLNYVSLLYKTKDEAQKSLDEITALVDKKEAEIAAEKEAETEDTSADES